MNKRNYKRKNFKVFKNKMSGRENILKCYKQKIRLDEIKKIR